MSGRSTVIRRATLGDAGSLARLAEGTFRAAFGALNRPENMEAYCGENFGAALQAREIADRTVVTLVAEEEDGLIGYGQLHWGSAPDVVHGARPAEIRRLYVEGRWHGKGVAQRLLSGLLAQARAGDADVVWLGVWEENPRAIAFYRKAGFTPVGEQVFRLWNDPQRDLVLARWPPSEPLGGRAGRCGSS